MTTERAIPEIIAANYRIEREIGRGGMAVVYRAHDIRHSRTVALKILNPDIAASLGKDRFLFEIHVAARLNHPHIVALYDSG
jgi:Serine/threonine protein kinase